MEKISYKLEVFEGPLDLLLSLIEKHKLDIFDIEISVLTEQYMEYIRSAKETNTALTAEFLEMASHLLYIKSCALLPSTDEEEDPKEALEQLLIEYAKYKKISLVLKDKYIGNLIFMRRSIPADLPTLSPDLSSNTDALLAAYARIVERNDRRKPIPMSSFKRLVGTKVISVSSKIVSVLKKLVKNGKTRFRSLFKDAHSRSGIVATFLAVLELIRGGRVDVVQSDSNDNDMDIVYLGKGEEENGDVIVQ